IPPRPRKEVTWDDVTDLVMRKLQALIRQLVSDGFTHAEAHAAAVARFELFCIVEDFAGRKRQEKKAADGKQQNGEDRTDAQ
ncbi:MAG: hypothetical protein J0H57_25625, partial [Rhodospirillales bacterium]|nr:hypothetical protein [Rhodospirillales bacterium]